MRQLARYSERKRPVFPKQQLFLAEGRGIWNSLNTQSTMPFSVESPKDLCLVAANASPALLGSSHVPHAASSRILSLTSCSIIARNPVIAAVHGE